MKRAMIIIVMLALMLSTAGISESAFEIESKVLDFFLNGESVTADGAGINCIVINGVVYAPVEELAAGLGYGYSYDGNAVNLSADGESAAQQDSDILGVWTAYLADSEAYMEFKSDGTCVLSLTSSVFIIDWELEGNTIHLTQDEAYLQAEFDPDNNRIKLFLGDTTVVFVR